MKYILVLVPFLISCGGTYDVNVHGNVGVTFDFSQLTSYFYYICTKELPNGTPLEINACVNEKITEFVNTVRSVN